ncbi:MAG: amidohydrolase family protein [Candidatus Tectomicrobia bacterium]|nr:amidohydrolase family protein [Candidatus Tectomicrobia bacterium]
MADNQLVDIVLCNAQVVTPSGVLRNSGVAVQGGHIVAVGEEDRLPPARRTIDGGGQYLLPGAIDPHTHPGPWGPFENDIRTETRSAAAGGVTTMVGIVKSTRMGQPYKKITEPQDVRSYGEVFPRARDIINEHAFVDMALTFAIVSDDYAREIPLCVEECGVTSFKFYLGYNRPNYFSRRIGLPTEWDDGTLFLGMEQIAKVGGLAAFHAENRQVARVLEERIKATGRKNLAAWEAASPDFLEAVDILKMGFFAKMLGCRIYVVHLNSRMGLEMVKRVRAEGVNITAEVCTQYLTLYDLEAEFPGAMAVNHPPIRDKSNADALWEGLAKGDIQCVGTDHVPGTRAELVTEGDVWKSFSGMATTELMLPILLSEGVNQGRFTIERVAQVASENTAKALNLFPRKGAIQVGSDADLVLVDLNLKRTVRGEDLHTMQDFCVFEGREFTGWPVLTMLRGEVIMEKGELVGDPRGTYLARTLDATPAAAGKGVK